MSELWDTIINNQHRYHKFTVDKTPEVSQVYLELKGGTFGNVYGGGNSATVTQNVDICLNNQTAKANLYNGANYQFDCVFGGNNKVEMGIQPTWHLIKGSVNNLYSGGNAGNMTYSQGLLLAITSPNMEVYLRTSRRVSMHPPHCTTSL